MSQEKLKRYLKTAAVLLIAVLSYFFAPDLWRDSESNKEKTESSTTKADIKQINQQLAKATIVSISDGDSFSVKGQDGKTYKVRLHGIDAPEKSQAYGEYCRQLLTNFIGRKTLKIEASKVDRYDRLIITAKVGNKDVALEQIRQGCGWHYVAYAKEQSEVARIAYATVEQEARKAKVGLWKDRKPQEPWEYRKQQR